MKFPKLRQTALCNFVLFLPVILCFSPLLFLLFFGDYGVLGLLVFPGIILALVYIFKNFIFLMTTNFTLGTIKAQKKDAEEFRTHKNGKSREEIEQRFIMRCKAFGKEETVMKREINPVCLVHKAVPSIQIFYSVINKNIAVFSFESLTEKEFENALKSANVHLRSVANSKDKLTKFRSKEEKNSPACRADIAIFLTDSLDESVKKLVRKKCVSNDTVCFLPCVVDCKNGAYYFDAECEHYEIGMMGKPPKNYAVSVAKKILFSGKPPYKTSTSAELKNPDDADFLNMSLWDFYKDFKKTNKEDESNFLKEVRRQLKTLNEGEFKIIDDIIYFKQNDRIVTFSLLSDYDNEKDVLLTVDNACFCRGKDKYPRKRLLKKIEKNAALHYIAAELKKQGYTVDFTEET